MGEADLREMSEGVTMAEHVLQRQDYRDAMRDHACEWRVESGSLPGLSTGDIVEIEATDDEYIFSKAGAGRVATLPVSSTEEDLNMSVICVLSC